MTVRVGWPFRYGSAMIWAVSSTLLIALAVTIIANLLYRMFDSRLPSWLVTRVDRRREGARQVTRPAAHSPLNRRPK
jgi:hypothetical protein